MTHLIQTNKKMVGVDEKGDEEKKWVARQRRQSLIVRAQCWGVFFHFVGFYNFFMYGGVLFVHMSVQQACAWCPWRPEENQAPWN